MMEQGEFELLKYAVETPPKNAGDAQSKLEKIRDQLRAAVADGSLQIVDREEVTLVAMFRIWKDSPSVSSGIFHYKRKARHEI